MKQSKYFLQLGRRYLRTHGGGFVVNQSRNSRQAFAQCKDDPQLGPILVGAVMHYRRVLRKTPEGPDRARMVHALVDKKIAEEKTGDPRNASKITCRRGCSFCCYQQVCVTPDEAELLKRFVTPEVHARLTEQLPLPEDPLAFAANWPKSRCAFLEEGGTCGVYEDRPMVCRTTLAISDPNNCDIQSAETHTWYFNAVDAEMVVTAAFTELGALPMAQALFEE